MNFGLSGLNFLSFLLKNLISKHILSSWVLARFFLTLQVLLSFAVTGELQLPCNSDLCAGRSEGPSALTAQGPEQPQKPTTLNSLEEGKNKCPEYSVCPKQSLRAAPLLSSSFLSSLSLQVFSFQGYIFGL